MATVGTVSATGNKEIDGLLSGYRWASGITYSFPDTAGDYGSGFSGGEEKAAGFAQVSAAQQTAVHAIMKEVESLTNLNIDYAGTDSADIRIAQSGAANPTAYAYYPASGQGGDVWFGTTYNYRNPKLGDYYYLTHTHELGHALGLKHAHEVGGPGSTALPSAHDSLEYSVMSYRSYPGGSTGGGYTNETYGYPTTFMMNDIRALQEMYGADYTTRSGDTVYSWSPTTGEFFIDGVGQGRPGGVSAPASANVILMTVWDGGGEDTYDFSNYNSGLRVDLNPGGSSVTSAAQVASLGGGKTAQGNVYNAYLYKGDGRSYIENVIGGSGNDTLIGNAAGNEIEGGAGNDTLTGGAGEDVFIFRSAFGKDIITDFSLGFDQIDFSGFNGVTDFASVMAAGLQSGANAILSFGLSLSVTLQNISLAALTATNFIFSWSEPLELNEAPTGIVLTGNEIDEHIAGDVVGTISVADPDGGAFTFTVSDSRFEVAGGPGNYVLKLRDGVSVDFEAEPNLTITVTATDEGGLSTSKSFNLAVNDLAGATITGSSGRDIIDGLRSVRNQANTTADDDVIDAGAGNDTVSGLAGDDRISGGAGDDILYGDTGNDRITGGAGADRVYGGAGDDVFVITGNEAQSDTISGGEGLDTIEVTGTGPTTLSRFSADVSSIEAWEGNNQAVLGTKSSDFLDFRSLQTSSGIAYVDTGGGNDALSGTSGADDLRGGSGNDTLFGGEGNDRLTGGSGTDTIDAGAGNDVFLFGGSDAQNDVMRGGEGLDSVEITGPGNVTLSRLDAGAQSIEAWHGNFAGVLGTKQADYLNFSSMTDVSGLSFIDGGSGNDRLTGSMAADDLRGGSGNDILTGGLGNDILTGGKGSDQFVYEGAGFGHDVITDFGAGSQHGDVIVIDQSLFADLDALLNASTEIGGSVVITVGMSDSITLEHTLLSNLHANDFAFV